MREFIEDHLDAGSEFRTVEILMERGRGQPAADADRERPGVEPPAYLVRGDAPSGHEGHVGERAAQGAQAVRSDQAGGNNFTARTTSARTAGFPQVLPVVHNAGFESPCGPTQRHPVSHLIDHKEL